MTRTIARAAAAFLGVSVLAGVPIGAQSAPPAPPRPAPKPMLGGSPKVSPDGTRILFTSNRDGTYALHVMRADGSGVARLTHDSAAAFPGGWSPDGRRIVFSGESKGGQTIVVMNADGSDRRVVGSARGDQTPAWSHDGSEIAFGSGEFPSINIHAMRADGTARRNLTRSAFFDYDPAWSPDGRQIAFVRGQRGIGPKIWIMNADGTEQRQLGGPDGAQERPSWSPDGRQVAYQSTDRSDRRETHVVVADVASGTERRITTHATPYHDETPSWFPDGERLAIQSDRDGAWAIYVIDLTGRTIARLTP